MVESTVTLSLESRRRDSPLNDREALMTLIGDVDCKNDFDTNQENAYNTVAAVR